MAEESDLEKTEEPSSKRLEKARTEGDVPRSRELSTFLILITSAGGFVMFGANLNQALMRNLSNSLSFNRDVVMDVNHIFKNNASPLMDIIVALWTNWYLIVLDCDVFTYINWWLEYQHRSANSKI